MPEYIDRQKLLKALSYEGTCRSKNSESPDLLRGLVIAILVAKKEVETADVEPVVRGHWLTWDEKFTGNAVGKNLGVFCSVCGNHSDYSSPYCPNCGAKMDKEDENDQSNN